MAPKCNELQPVLPSLADSGWVLSKGKLSAHITDNLQAPLATIEMSGCKCDKSKCVRGNCSCYQIIHMFPDFTGSSTKTS